MNSPATRHSSDGFNMIESIVVLATIGVLVFITIPILRVYLFESKSEGAPVYIEKRGVEEPLPGKQDRRFEDANNADSDSPQ